MRTTIWWIRRDVRLADNQALQAALTQSGAVIPLFVLDPNLLGGASSSQRRTKFLLGGLRCLDEDLRRLSSRLIIRRGKPVEELHRLAHDAQASAIYAEADYGPYARRRDQQVGEQLPLHLVEGLTIHPPGSVLTNGGNPYTVFTPFGQRWQSLPLPGLQSVLPAPAWLPALPSELGGLHIPEEKGSSGESPFVPGEQEAYRRLRRFIDRLEAPIYAYTDVRDRMDRDGTSQLSPYLRFGMLSARQVVLSATSALQTAPDSAARTGAASWLRQLIWREFYIHILFHFPHVLRCSFRDRFDNIPWSNDRAAFDAWREGRTGYPIVDAAMRQLTATGWMHNRARMIAASFLVKDLLIDWRWGERWFKQNLIDGDPAANNGGWQWTAGTGTDAAPYFRVFNPTLQGRKFDPRGDYVRRWLPELAPVPAPAIHQPWTMPGDLQRSLGVIIGRDYPAPIVDHTRARERALAAYAQAGA